MLAAAGCGSGGSHTTTTSAVTAPATTTSAAGATTTAGAGATTGAQGAGALGALGALASVAHCGAFAKLEAALVKAIAGGGGSLAANAAVIERLATQSPPAVRADVELIAAAFAKVATATPASGGHASAADQLKALERLAAGLNSPAVKHAEAGVEAWAAHGCSG